LLRQNSRLLGVSPAISTSTASGSRKPLR